MADGPEEGECSEEFTRVEAVASEVAVLLLVLDGLEGTAMLSECARSFLAPGATGLFVADVALVAASRKLELELGSAAARVRIQQVRAFPGARADKALEALRALALEAGFTHALVGRSHEMLVRTSDRQQVEALPVGWESVDFGQAASNVGWRPRVDVLVALAHARFWGPLLPAPVPIDKRRLFNAYAWKGVAVWANARQVARSRAFDLVLQAKEALAETEGDPDLRKVEHKLVGYQVMLALAQAQLLESAIGASQALEDDSDNQHRVFVLRTLRASWQFKLGLAAKLDPALLAQFVKTAAEGLALGYADGLVILHKYLLLHEMGELTTAALGAVAPHLAAQASKSAWFNDPNVAGLHVPLCLMEGLELWGRRAALEEEESHGFGLPAAPAGRPVLGHYLTSEDALEAGRAARRHPAGKHNKHLAELCRRIGEDEVLACVAPAGTAFLPDTVVQAGVLRPEKAAEMKRLVAALPQERPYWEWPLHLAAKVLRVPADVVWGGTVTRVQTVVAAAAASSNQHPLSSHPFYGPFYKGGTAAAPISSAYYGQRSLVVVRGEGSELPTELDIQHTAGGAGYVLVMPLFGSGGRMLVELGETLGVLAARSGELLLVRCAETASRLVVQAGSDRPCLVAAVAAV